MAGPKFNGVDDQCKYTPDIKKADTSSMLTFSGPVFPGLPGGSKYNEAPMRSPLEGTRLMTAPIFPGIEASNKYGPVEPELAPKEKIKVEKPFVAPNYPGIEYKNSYNLDQIENGMPTPFKAEEGSIMVGPKYPGIQDSGYEYNPPSTRGQLPKVEVISAPVFVEDGANKYSVVPEKTHGELLHPLPLHGPGVEAKNAYNPDIKKADTSSMLTFSGPVFPGLPGGSLYNEAPMKSPLDGQRLMTTPIFPGIKAENSFGPASMGF